MTLGFVSRSRWRRWFGRCVVKRRVGPVFVQWRPSSMNRPWLRGGWADETDGWLSLSWGNRNSDPVWGISIYVTPRPGSLLARVVDHMEGKPW